MSTVAARKRAKAAATTPPAKVDPRTFGDYLQIAREQLGKADAVLSQAWDAAELGEPIDTLLRHVVENLLPDAVYLPLQKERPTAAEIDQVYHALSAPIACLIGAAQLADGTLLFEPLRVAGEMLDDLQDMCSDAAPLATMAPEREPGPGLPANPASAPPQEKESNLDRSLRMPFSNAIATLEEAAAILRMYLDSVAEPTQGSLGLHRLMEVTVSAANENEVAALWEIDAAERVQADMETVADLCSLVSEHDGGLVMEGTRALVQVACEALDRHVEILHQEREGPSC